MTLDKEVKDFKGYSAELEVLCTTEYFHLAVGIDYECCKETQIYIQY